MKMAKTMRPDQSILVNLSGRGDKDIGTVADLSNASFYCRPSCQGQGVKGGPAGTEQVIEFRRDAGQPQVAPTPSGGSKDTSVPSVGAMK
jgi:hypothetical protein